MAGLPDKQSLSIDVLVNGFCQAYVDFFYLTHRPEPSGSDDKVEDAGIPPRHSRESMRAKMLLMGINPDEPAEH